MFRIYFPFGFHFSFKTQGSLQTEFSWIHFSSKDLKTFLGSLIEIIETYVLNRFEQLRKISENN